MLKGHFFKANLQQSRWPSAELFRSFGWKLDGDDRGSCETWAAKKPSTFGVTSRAFFLSIGSVFNSYLIKKYPLYLNSLWELSHLPYSIPFLSTLAQHNEFSPKTSREKQWSMWFLIVSLLRFLPLLLGHGRRTPKQIPPTRSMRRAILALVPAQTWPVAVMGVLEGGRKKSSPETFPDNYTPQPKPSQVFKNAWWKKNACFFPW